ncbi:hypothetical protein [Acinetobacter sp. ANC 4635]|uniref:hypothetical protein n=1 Tax=Acinetobacter sp. ANC 4635 TaxID=2529846 RepID=UPI000D5FC0DE|nr:hypothetical protein [Acinetobacter sp. ANC 4635]PVZ90096.1 hypothetical protein C9426_01585 [Serratia sp. S1B]TCB31970.1 hypothetical protein E0H86_06000 [Acinetobacter sp. ANC 4635]
MKQKHIPSQMPATSARLYQHPTAQEQRPNRLKVVLANTKDFALFASIGTLCYVAITAVVYALGGGMS